MLAQGSAEYMNLVCSTKVAAQKNATTTGQLQMQVGTVRWNGQHQTISRSGTHTFRIYIYIYSRVAQEACLEIEYIRKVLSVSGTLKYADSGTA